MKYVFAQNRRQFLLGLGGASLALPILPSLLRMPKAEAQALAAQKYFAYMELPHGAVVQTQAFPPDSMATEMKSYAGFNLRRGVLPSTATNGDVQLSGVLRAPSTLLTPGLLAKMNVIRGVDLTHYPGHGSGQSLGNYGDIVGGAIGDGDFTRPTIDQIMAWAPSFYGSTAVTERAIVLGEISWANSNPAAHTGAVQRVSQSAPTNVALFDKLFGSQTQTGSGGAPPPPNTLLVDKVVANYQRLISSGKLSSVDQKRIDDHLQRVFELQKKLSQPKQSFGTIPPRPGTATVDSSSDGYDVDPAAQVANINLWTDIVAAAFSVGASRIFTANLMETFSNYVGDWHDLAHSSEADRTATYVKANQLFFSGVFAELARKLDAISMGDGTTLLDASLISWGHESGSNSHFGTGMPLITFGSARGFLKTGQYLDFRNLNKQLINPPFEASWHGLAWHQWLGTALQAVGVPKTEYAGLTGGSAYPDIRPGDLSDLLPGDPGGRYPGTEAPYTDAVYAAAGELLPWMG